jgi:hypothetical protein
MSRRESVIASSSSSISTITLGNGHVNGAPTLAKAPSQMISSGALSKVSRDNMDPDELFVKHNISEMKLIQQRLRYLYVFLMSNKK